MSFPTPSYQSIILVSVENAAGNFAELPLIIAKELEKEGEQSAIEVGVSQVKALCLARKKPLNQGLDVIVADGPYGNHHFFGPLQALECAGLAQLRRDRVLFGSPP